MKIFEHYHFHGRQSMFTFFHKMKVLISSHESIFIQMVIIQNERKGKKKRKHLREQPFTVLDPHPIQTNASFLTNYHFPQSASQLNPPSSIKLQIHGFSRKPENIVTQL